MKQGGRDLTDQELNGILDEIGRDIFKGLEGIDAENTAAYFDDALESLVQQHGFWARGYDVEQEYNRSDLRIQAISRALWATLVIQGYAPVANESGYGKWPVYDEDAIFDETQKRAEMYDNA